MISSLASKCQEFKPRGLQFQFKKRLKNGHPNFKGLQFWSQIYVAISPSSKFFILQESNIEKLAQWDVGSWYGIKKEYIKIFSSLSPQDVKTFNWIAGPLLETISKFDRLKNWVPDCSGQEFDEKILVSEHVLKVYFKPSRQNKDFVFLPDPILPL